MIQRTINLPQICYVCCKPADRNEHVTTVEHLHSTRLSVPVCGSCEHRKRMAQRAFFVSMTVFCLAALFGIGFAAELGYRSRQPGVSVLTKAISTLVSIALLLILSVVVGSFSGSVRDGVKAVALRIRGVFGSWREAWTWVRHSRIGSDPATGFPVFRNPTYSRLFTEANRNRFDPAIHMPGGRDL